MTPADTRSRAWAVYVTVATMIVLIAAFMPWGEIRVGGPSISIRGPDGYAMPADFGAAMLGSQSMTIPITGWSGNLTIAGVKLPNWTIVLIAFGVAAHGWLLAMDVIAAPRYLGTSLAAIGLLLTVLAMAIFLSAGGATLGVGLVLTMIAMAGQLLASLFLVFNKQPPISAGPVA